MSTLCVFCGSSPGTDPAYLAAARDTGREIALRGHTLVYGGGQVGLMGAVANAALQAGGAVVGVIPRSLNTRELAHHGLARLEIVETLAERKRRMSELSEAYLSLPGGIGTLDEMFEAWTLGQIGLESKPNGLLNVAGYFDPLIAFLDRAVEQGFLRLQHRAMLRVATEVGPLIEALSARA